MFTFNYTRHLPILSLWLVTCFISMSPVHSQLNLAQLEYRSIFLNCLTISFVYELSSVIFKVYF